MDETDADSVSKADLSDKDDEYEEKVGGGGRRIFSPEDGELIGGSFALPAWVFVITRILFSGFHFSLGTTVLVSANVLIGKLSGYKWLYRLAGGVHVIMLPSVIFEQLGLHHREHQYHLHRLIHHRHQHQ